MQKHVGLTEKRMADKRFRKTEEAILKVFFEGDYYICMGEVAKKVGVARSTVYNHHRAVREILPDYEKYILRKYKRMIRKMGKNMSMNRIYFRTIFFIMQEKKIFSMLIKNERRTIFFRMIFEMEVKIINYARLPKNSEKIFKIYVGEIVELIWEWGKDGFRETEIKALVSEIIYLTDTMRIRLSPMLAR